MATIVIFLAMVPVVVGYFLGTVFLPLAVILAGAFFLIGLVITPFYLFFRTLVRSSVPLYSRRVLAEKVSGQMLPLVDFAIHFPQFLFGGRAVANLGKIYCQSEVGQMLVRAQALLEGPFQLRVAKCYDSLSMHAREAFIDPREIQAHESGRAIDVTLVGRRGKPLNLGKFNWNHRRACSEVDRLDSQAVTHEVQSNRQMLSRVLHEVGFVNDPQEWWHWSLATAEAPGRASATFRKSRVTHLLR